MKPENILDAKISFPKVVYIVGTGPENPMVHDGIPEDAFIIALNGAIEYELPAVPAIWLMGDPNVVTKDYFRPNMELIRCAGFDIGPLGIQAGGPTVPILEADKLHKEAPWVRCVYKIAKGGMQEQGSLSKTAGKLRIGATIAGAALQLAVFMGAKTIRLVGIGLYGDRYHGGAHHEDPAREGKDWAAKDAFDWLVRVLNKNGYSIRHLNDDIHPESTGDETIPTIRKYILSKERKSAPEIEFPSEVIILGTGPNGLAGYHKIKPDDFVIAVNGAIGIEKISPRMWICADGMTAKRDYFRPGNERCEKEGITRVWSYAVRDRAAGSKPDYLFPMVHVHDPGFRHVPDRVRPDATVVGIAIDLCYRRGVKSVKLIGVDMGGDTYFDGSQSPGNVDDKHGPVWDMRNELDDEIRWMHTHGLRVSTLTDTKLSEPHGDYSEALPSVALLTMAFHPVFTKHAIFNAAIQQYPDRFKALYLIYQNGEQPIVATDLTFRIIQENVDGVWPELWLQKLLRFFEVATEDYIAIWDEDDYFEPDYIGKAIDAIQQNNAVMSWTFENEYVTREFIKRGMYRSAFGTIVVKRDIAFKVAKSLWREVYDEKWEPGAIPPDKKFGGRGCQDMNYQHGLIKVIEGVSVRQNSEFESGERIVLHDGIRWYTYHRNSNTCSGRLDEQCIDYNIPEAWYKGTVFQEARDRANKKKKKR